MRHERMQRRRELLPRRGARSSMVEFTLRGADDKVLYDVSLVDGYNAGIAWLRRAPG